jgi:hypothetical protein
MKINSILNKLRQFINPPVKVDAPIRPHSPAKSRANLPIVACHFFGDHSSLGFWDDQQLDRVPSLFDTIKHDGFTTIVLVVPLEPFIEAQPNTGLNEWYWSRLASVLHMAEAAGLSVFLRLAYLNSTSPDNQTWVVKRQMQLLDHATAQPWLLAYFEKIAEVVKSSKAYAGSFLAWEDFWLVFEHPPNLPESERVKIAEQVGLKRHATTWANDPQLRTILGPDATRWPSEIVPTPNTPASALWMKWFDYLVFDFVGGCAKTHLPDIAFEIRSDAYPINTDGKYTWATFELQRGTQGRRFGYWGAFYGAANNGEMLSARKALRGLEYYLDVMNGEGMSADIVLEQFNIVDNTLDFVGTNARIAPASLPDFLKAAAVVIAQRTSGYGLWTYRNYRENWLSNSAFQRGLHGWTAEGKLAIVCEHAGATQWLVMPSGTAVTQDIHGVLRLQSPISSYPPFRILIRVKNENDDDNEIAATHRDLVVTVAGHELIPGGEDHGRFSYAVPSSTLSNGIFTISIRNVSPAALKISDLALYAYEQVGGLYDANQNELPMAALIRKFNNDLRGANIDGHHEA